jgi:hypothetical protein
MRALKCKRIRLRAMRTLDFSVLLGGHCDDADDEIDSLPLQALRTTK